MRKLRFKKNQLVVFFVFLFFFIGLIFRVVKLQAQPFYEWDEGIYAQVAKEIIKNRSLKTTFNDQVWLNKPPLSHLLISLSFILFPNHQELASRLIFVFFSFFTLIISYKLAKKIFKDRLLALLTPTFLISSKIYLERSTILNTDIIIALSWLGHLYYINSFWKKTFFLVLGVWSKSLVGFYPLFFDLVYFFIGKNWQKNKGLIRLIKGFTIQISLASLWYFYSFYYYGHYFFKAHFYDQIFKRAVKPIELHWNKLGKLYYPTLFWQDSKVLSIFFLIGSFLIFLKLVSLWQKNNINLFFSQQFKKIVNLLFPLPIIVLLVFSKSKIYWYFVFILPFLSLVATYPLSLIKKNYLKKSLIFILLVVNSLLFFKNTYAYQHQPDINEKFYLAQCVKKLPYSRLAFLVHINDRINYQFLKQNDLDTETSFVYGGSPSFVYYSDKKTRFFYKEDQFKKDYQKYPIVIVQKNDILNLNLNFDNYNNVCVSKNILDHERWHVFVKAQNR